jgi:hypothetical protein
MQCLIQSYSSQLWLRFGLVHYAARGLKQLNISWETWLAGEDKEGREIWEKMNLNLWGIAE